MARSPKRRAPETSPDRRRGHRDWQDERQLWRRNYDYEYRTSLGGRDFCEGQRSRERDGRGGYTGGSGGGGRFQDGYRRERGRSRERNVHHDQKTPLKRETSDKHHVSGPVKKPRIIEVKSDDEVDIPKEPKETKAKKEILKSKVDEIGEETKEELKRKLKDITKEMVSLRKKSELKLNTLTKTKNLEKKNKELEEKLEGKKLKIMELEDSLEKTRQEYADHKGKYEENNPEIKEAMKLLEAEAEKLRGENEVAMERLKIAENKEIEEVENSEKFMRIKEERNEIRLNLIKQSTEINKLKHDLDDVEEKLQKALKSGKGEDLEKLKHSNAKLAKSLDERNCTLKRVRGERERAQDRLEVLKKEFSELEGSKVVVEEELREKTEAWLNKRDELENKINGLTIEVLNCDSKKTSDAVSEDEYDDAEDSLKIVDDVVNKSTDESDDDDDDSQQDSASASPSFVTRVTEGTNNLENSQPLIGSPSLFDSVILASDEEFADDCTRVNNIEVMNFKNPLDCSSKNINAPMKYTGKFFVPSVCSLNNKINFVATNDRSTPHNPDIKGFCGLQPHCCVKFVEGTMISKVFITETISHQKNEEEVWCCAHHSRASALGFKLQTQRTMRKKSLVRATPKAAAKTVTNDDELVDVSPLIPGVTSLYRKEASRQVVVDGKKKSSTSTPRPRSTATTRASSSSSATPRASSSIATPR